MKELKNPEFLLCDIPVKTGDPIEDNRQFIYCPKYLSLIEVIPMDVFTAAFPMDQVQKTFFYNNEEYLLVFTQNNVDVISGANEIQNLTNGTKPTTSEDILKMAWQFFENYLTWEDNE